MNIRHTLKLATASVLSVLTLTSCSLLQSNKVSGSEGRVVTLADGRKVVVSGQKQADGTITSTTTSTTSSTTTSSKSNAKKTESTKKADKSTTTKASKKEKSLTPPKAEKSKKESKQKKSKKSKDAKIVSSDRQAIETTVANAEAAAAAKAPAVAVATDSIEPTKETTSSTTESANFTINGEWTIYSVRGNLVTGEERPYVTFDLAANRFYGNNGCNYINGDLTVDGKQLKLDNMISTMKLCENDQLQYLINLALSDVVTYSVREESPITFLDMQDNSGRAILVLRRHNMDFLNGAWKVTELNGPPLELGDDEASLTFDTVDLKIHGTTGCNIFNGELFIDPDKTNSLQIIKLITTKMSCPNDSRETEFMLGLEEVETAIQTNINDVTLYDTENRPVFKLEKMDLSNDSE
jgi:heat shock protein HslJ